MRGLQEQEEYAMLETLLTLPGFIYQTGGNYYFLGKWICKECTDVDATDSVAMYQMCRDAKEEKNAARTDRTISDVKRKPAYAPYRCF